MAAIYSRYLRRAWYPYTKGLPNVFLIVVLAVMARLPFGELPPLYIAVALGLALGLGGDLFLLHKKLFLPGLVSFLLGHLAYIWGLWPEVWKLSLFWYSLYIFGLIFFVWLGRHLYRNKQAHFILAVLLYIAVITTMVVVAAAWRATPPGYSIFLWGAWAFLLSDCLLAIHYFVRPFAADQVLILTSYYSAQALFAYGALYGIGLSFS
jgi:uncharacterized membrane protein YhhN